MVIRNGFGFRIVLSPSLGQRGMQCPTANSHLGGGGDRNFALLKDLCVSFGRVQVNGCVEEEEDFNDTVTVRNT